MNREVSEDTLAGSEKQCHRGDVLNEVPRDTVPGKERSHRGLGWTLGPKLKAHPRYRVLPDTRPG